MAAGEINQAGIGRLVGSIGGTTVAAYPQIQPDPVGVYQHAQRLIEEIAETRDLFSILEERLGHGLKSPYPENQGGPDDCDPMPNRCPAANTLDAARADLARLRAYIRSVTERVDL